MTPELFILTYPTSTEVEAKLKHLKGLGTIRLLAFLRKFLNLAFPSLIFEDVGYYEYSTYPIRVVEKDKAAQFTTGRDCICEIGTVEWSSLYFTNVFGVEELHSIIKQKTKTNENNKVSATPSGTEERNGTTGKPEFPSSESKIAIAGGQNFNGREASISRGRIEVGQGYISF